MGVAWAAAVTVAIVAILVLAGLAWRSTSEARDRWERLLDTQVTDLVDTERLAAVSALGVLLTRDAVTSADPLAFRALGANQAEIRDLLERARARVRTPEEAALVAAITDDQRRIEQIGATLAQARLHGAPPRLLVERLRAEIGPIRIRVDEALARDLRLHRDALVRERAEIAEGERRALVGLVLAATGAVALAVVLGTNLGRSVGALRRSEARFRATFEEAASGIAHVGLDGRWLRLNRRYRELLGYDEAELATRTFGELLHPEDRAADAAQLERLLSGAITGYALEARFLCRRADVCWVHLSCAVVRDRAGRPAYLVRGAEDLSPRKRVERDLRDAVRVRDEFLKIASHELRTPLATLRLQVESLRATLRRGDVDPRRLEAKADAALRQAGRLDGLVGALIDVSVVSDADIALTPDEVDVADLARAVVERVAPDAARDRTELRLHVPGPVRAVVDRARIEQALTQLVANAIRYGAGHPVDVAVEGDGARVRISVHDRGIGIDPADVERIFRRFERASSWRNYGGLGLGLFLTRRIAEAHGGTVRVQAAPGEGATFVLELPRGLGAAEEASREDRARAASRDHPRA